MKIRDGAENLFAWIGRTSAQRPWLYIGFSLLLLLVSVWQLQYLVVDTTTEGFLKKDDPAILVFNDFKAEFGRDEQFTVALETDQLFTPGVMQQFIAMHEAFALEVPFIDEVNSLYNARDIYGEEGDLVVEDLLDELPEDEAGWQALKAKVLGNKLYRNAYISADGGMVTIHVRPVVSFAVTDPESGESRQEVLGEIQIHEMSLALQGIIARYPELAPHIRMAGTPVLTEELSIYLVGDMLKFIAAALVIIAAVLFFLFRTWWGILLPLVVVVTALVSTMALMSITGQPVQTPTVILPSFVLSVGISDAVHLISLFIVRMREGDDQAAAIEYTMRHVGIPIFFTILTTAAGLFSFGGSDILPVANLGWFSAAGVFFAFVYTIILLPAMLAITPVHIQPLDVQHRRTWIDGFIDFSVVFSRNHTLKIVAFTSALAVVAIYGAMQLTFSHDPIKWLPDDSPGRQSILLVGKRFGGLVSVEVVVDTGKVDGIKDPAFMRTLDETVQFLEQYRTEQLEVGKVISVPAMLKETNRALMDNDPAAYAIPDSRELIAQEFLMLETSGAKDLYRLVDSNYQKARITIMLPWVDALYFGDYVRGLEAILQERFAGQAQTQVTGIVPMLSKVLKKIMQATAMSYAFAFVVITTMIILLLGSVKYGLVSMVPNILPITVTLALMHVMGAPLDMFSMLIGSIAMGLAVDDTVHFMDGFRHIYEKTGDVERAIAETLDVSGRAMLSTSTVLTLGFLIYLLSPMHNLEDFGLYTALCIVLAMLCDFWMTPALLRLLHRKPAADSETPADKARGA